MNAADTPSQPVEINQTAALCKAAGDPLRLQVLKVLEQNAYGVLELAAIFGIRQSAMSHHLKILTKAGLVATRREGTTIFYRRHHLVDSELAPLQRALFERINQCKLSPNFAAAQQRVNAERAQASLEFFQQNAERFRQNQDLIASWRDYGASIENFLVDHFPPGGEALEIGPGCGEFLAVLAKHFRQVVAVDNSPQMLDTCRQQAASENLQNIRFVHGDSVAEVKAVDCIVLNMVLHHNSVPAEIIKNCAQRLNAGGAMLITELCAHDQEWVKGACGDLWLGFEPEDLAQWAAQCGLREGASQYLALRNGFRIQIRQFYRP